MDCRDKHIYRFKFLDQAGTLKHGERYRVLKYRKENGEVWAYVYDLHHCDILMRVLQYLNEETFQSAWVMDE